MTTKFEIRKRELEVFLEISKKKREILQAEIIMLDKEISRAWKELFETTNRIGRIRFNTI